MKKYIFVSLFSLCSIFIGNLSAQEISTSKVDFVRDQKAAAAQALRLQETPNSRLDFLVVNQHDDMLNAATPDKIRKDFIPDYAQKPTILINTSGKWSDLTKNLKIKDTDIILIEAGVKVIYDIESRNRIEAMAIKGTLEFSSDKSVSLHVGTIILYKGGVLNVKPNAVVDHKIMFSGVVDKEVDPYQMMIGLVTTAGEVNIEGRSVKNPYLRMKSYDRNLNQIELENEVDWQVGDDLILTAGQNTALAKIVFINGNRITLNQSLNFQPTGYVVLAKRNVVIQTAEKSPYRGHILFAGDTKVTFKNAAIVDMGRTTTDVLMSSKKNSSGKVMAGNNQIGRYPVHFHHVMQRFLFEGNVVYGNRKETVVKSYKLRTPEVDPMLPYKVIYTQNLASKSINTSLTFIMPHNDTLRLSIRKTPKLQFYADNGTQGRNIPGGFTAVEKEKVKIEKGFVYYFDGSLWVDSGYRVATPQVQEDGKVSILDPLSMKLVYIGLVELKQPLGSPRWGVVSHNSFGDVRHSVVVGAEGAGIVAEEGLEAGVFEKNLVIGTGGGSGEPDDRRFFDFNLLRTDWGHGGFGYWTGSGTVELVDNIADGLFRVNSYTIWVGYDLEAKAIPLNLSGRRFMPDVEGMPKDQKGQWKWYGIRRFEGNISYADVESGYSLSIGNVLSSGEPFFAVFKGMSFHRILNYTSYKAGIDVQSDQLTFENIKLYGNGKGIGIYGEACRAFHLINAHIENFEKGIYLSRTNTLLTDVNLVNNKIPIDKRKSASNMANAYTVETTKEVEARKTQIDEEIRADLKKEKGVYHYAALLNPYNPLTRFHDQAGKGWAVITLDEVNKNIQIRYKFEGINHKLHFVGVGILPSDLTDRQKKEQEGELLNRWFIDGQKPPFVQGQVYTINIPYGKKPYLFDKGELQALKEGRWNFKVFSDLNAGSQLKKRPEISGYFLPKTE